MTASAHLDHGVVNSFLRGLHYPLTPDELVHLAKLNNVKGEYLDAFQSLPKHAYMSQDEVMNAIKQEGYSLS